MNTNCLTCNHKWVRCGIHEFYCPKCHANKSMRDNGIWIYHDASGNRFTCIEPPTSEEMQRLEEEIQATHKEH